MSWLDTLRLALGSLRFTPVRTALTVLAMAIGVAAVLLLTALGEGARAYVVREFASLGTHLLFVLPGHAHTRGLSLATGLVSSVRPLTLDDAAALKGLPAVAAVAPIVVGSAQVRAGGIGRDSVVLGSTAELRTVRHWRMQRGRFLDPGDWHRARAQCVLGPTVARALFGNARAVGKRVRIGDRRFRVVGILASVGRTFGFDNGELVIVPVAAAQALFDREGLFRILVAARNEATLASARRSVRRVLLRRHRGHEDFTLLTQGALLATFERILRALTLAVATIAAVSLGVAGVLIMNVQLIGVARRVPEIGLLRALGATRGQVLGLFLCESGLLSLGGALAGVAAGMLGAGLLGAMLPALAPLHAPAWAGLAAPALAVGTGLLFGLLPARRAAALDPVRALERR
ncbi:MAG: ABC transporter permease [Gammaproteobacteria bacterium]|nr:MAG: ABC transporter permease [Gammaproteobacteria bacterium]